MHETREGAAVPDQQEPLEPTDDDAAVEVHTVADVDGAADHDATPLLRATNLGRRSGDRWVFRHLHLAAPAGSVTALVAPAGTGRSTALLALVGRFAITEGTVELGGRARTTDLRVIRNRTSVARVADLVIPEGRLTVAESVTERCLIDAIRTAAGRHAFDEICAALDVTFAPDALVEDLRPWQQTVLALILAALRPADVIVLDDTDSGVTESEEAAVYRSALALAERGCVVVTSTARRRAVPDGVTVVDLVTEPIANPARHAQSEGHH